MKKFILLMFLSISLLNCQKDNSLLVKDIPDWLKNHISGLEQTIKNDPISIAAYTAWIRYEWNNENYFEYFNPPSSMKTGPKKMNGNILDLSDPQYANYEKEKCCMVYVWKGLKFSK